MRENETIAKVHSYGPYGWIECARCHDHLQRSCRFCPTCGRRITRLEHQREKR